MVGKVGHAVSGMALAAGAVIVVAASAQVTSAPANAPVGEVLALVPGDRIENVIEAADGSLYFTATFGGKVMRRAPDGTVSVFAALPNPQAIVAVGRNFAVDYQLRKPDFAAGGRIPFKGLGAQLAVVDARGKVLRTLPAPDENAFFNGMAALDESTLFIADPGGDRILRADLRSGKIEPWFTPPPGTAPSGAPLAPNGLKVHKRWVYFARGDVQLVRIGGDGAPAGAMELAAKTGGTDDFDVAADGTVYASHGSDVIKATASGAVSNFVTAGCPFCTATSVSRDAKWLYVTGGSVPGRPGPSVAGFVSRIRIVD